MKRLFIFFLMFLTISSCRQKQTNTAHNGISDSTVNRIAREAYIYGLPLVILDISIRQFNNPAISGKEYAKPNTFSHRSDFPDASFRSIVRPNADTYYSTAILDLSKEPVILSVPNTHGRYYMMPMLDAYTNVFASPGTRTTGNEAGDFLISGPGWKGSMPKGMKQINAPTNTVWIIGRTQVNSKEDGEKIVVPLQREYKLTPLSYWKKTYTPPEINPDTSAPKGDPNAIVKNMPIDEYFNYVNQLLKKYPPPAADNKVMEQFASIGIEPGKEFDLNSFSESQKTMLTGIPAEVFESFNKELTGAGQQKNGWTVSRGTIGTYGTNYNARASVSFFGLGANLPEDAMYPSCAVDEDGNLLNGANKYVIHFDKGNTPPANAFWSLTVYDSDGYFIDNPINRYAIGDRSNLKTNADGSIDIYFQNTSPGKEKESNWLPSPKGNFNLLMRVYWPKEEMIKGEWEIPPVKKY